MLDFLINFRLVSKADLVSKKINDIISLSGKKVLVGVPQENDSRENGEGIGNAALAYIHDKGSPLNNIPSRPFMQPGIRKAQETINTHMLAAAKAQLNDKDVEVYLHRAGVVARNGIVGIINTGEGLVPLKRETLLRRTRGKRRYLWKLTKEQKEVLKSEGLGLRGVEARRLMKSNREVIMASMHPLIDTGALRNSITYVISDQPVSKVDIPIINSDRKSQQMKGKSFEGMMLKENVEKGMNLTKKVSDELGAFLR